MFKGEERLITIPGFTIAARKWGRPDGHPVLALHGWIDNAASFDFLAPLLPDIHIIAVDSVGCGHSSHRSEGSFPSIIDEVFYTLQLANALGWERFTLMGHSRGGIIAQLVAAGAPERIRSLILLDIVGILHGEDIVEQLRNSIKVAIDTPPRPATLYPDLNIATRGRMMSSTMKYESAFALTVRGTTPVEGGYKWTFDRRELTFKTPIKMNYKQVKAIITGIECPTCIIFAEDGIIKGNPLVEETALLIKNHLIKMVPGHHHVHMDDPEVVASIIQPFLLQV